MIKSISELTDTIFEKIPYNQQTEEAKSRIRSALEKEYLRLLENGKNEVQAFGELMYKYGTIEDAAAFAGINKRKLSRLLSTEPTYDRYMFKKSFHKLQALSVIAAAGISGAAMYMIQAILLKAPNYLFSIVINLLLVFLALLPYRKKKTSFSYESISLSADLKTEFDIYCDRYRKRLVNTLLLLLVCIVNFFGVFERFIAANLNTDELVAFVCSHLFIVAMGGFLFLYNALISRFLLNGVSNSKRTAFWKYMKKAGIICGGFLACLLITALILRQFMKNPFPVIYLMTLISLPLGLVANYNLRRKVVIKNIRINVMRLTIFSLAGIFLLTVHRMQQDTYVLQPYIMGIPEISHTPREISYDETSGVYTISAGEDAFKILHLTDIHIGGSVLSSYKDYKALSACYKLISYTQPDLVIVTGDLVFPMGIMSFSLNNEAPVMQFASFMRNIGIPWAFTYGNHDTERMATGTPEEIGKLYQALSYKNSGTLLYPYTQPEITGRNNQLIRIENPDGSTRQALFLIDSNAYTGDGVNDYDYIHDDQVDWYADEVRKLSNKEENVVPSMIFFHIPLQEYRTAYELYEKGNDEVNYYFGEVGETMMEKICASKYPSKLFDTAVDLGSTKAMFCGHDHYNNISLGYQGIRLTYGMSIDYLAMPGIDKDTKQRGAELITISPDSEFEVEQIRLMDIE